MSRWQGQQVDTKFFISSPHAQMFNSLFYSRYECPPGLAYDQVSHTCLWISEVPDCSFKTIPIDETEEFSCPTDSPAGAFTKHVNPLDCRQFFLCIGGIPREQGCPLGEVFDEGLLIPLNICNCMFIFIICQTIQQVDIDSYYCNYLWLLQYLLCQIWYLIWTSEI